LYEIVEFTAYSQQHKTEVTEDVTKKLSLLPTPYNTSYLERVDIQNI
jgi:hypothetical protein